MSTGYEHAATVTTVEPAAELHLPDRWHWPGQDADASDLTRTACEARAASHERGAPLLRRLADAIGQL